MIDLLATSNGKITNLRRVTYLVMDEADRMFDMGEWYADAASDLDPPVTGCTRQGACRAV
jgi:hypothetical protein